MEFNFWHQVITGPFASPESYAKGITYCMSFLLKFIFMPQAPNRIKVAPAGIFTSGLKGSDDYITPNISYETSKGSLLGGEWDVNDEYDPRWPNDYEKIKKEKREAREAERLYVFLQSQK